MYGVCKKCKSFPPGNAPVLSIPSSDLLFPHLCCQLVLPEHLQGKEGGWTPGKTQIQLLPLPSKENAEVQFTAGSFCRVFNALVNPQQYLHCKEEVQRFGFVEN